VKQKLPAVAADDSRRPVLTLLSLVPSFSLPTDLGDETVLSADPPALISNNTTTSDLAMDEEMAASALGQFRTEFYDQDLLTCGVCRREFPLSDILKFIRHKVKSCSAKKSGCSDRMNDGDEDEDEDEEEVIDDEDCSTPSPSPPGSEPQSPVRLLNQTPGIINSSQRHKFKLIPPKQQQQQKQKQHQQTQQQQQQSYPHHRSFILNQSPFNSQKSSGRSHHRSDKQKKEACNNSSPHSGQSVITLTLSHFHTRFIILIIILINCLNLTRMRMSPHPVS
jgi:hypothetical protein